MLARRVEEQFHEQDIDLSGSWDGTRRLAMPRGAAGREHPGQITHRVQNRLPAKKQDHAHQRNGAGEANRKELDRNGHGTGFLRAHGHAGAVQGQDRKGAGDRMSRRRVASCRRRSGERLSLPGLAAELPDQQSDGQTRNHRFKAIQGNDSFYVAQVAFKAWPSKEQLTQWMRYLQDVTVCDTRLPDRACAAPGAGQ
jgi:hypothetical protein